MSRPPYVRNGSNARQADFARRKIAQRDAERQAAMRDVLDTYAGRMVLAWLIEEAGVYESVYRHSGSEMCFLEGRRNYGLELMAEMVRANEPGYEALERERRERQRRDEDETAAVHARSAADEGDED